MKESVRPRGACSRAHGPAALCSRARSKWRAPGRGARSHTRRCPARSRRCRAARRARRSRSRAHPGRPRQPPTAHPPPPRPPTCAAPARLLRPRGTRPQACPRSARPRVSCARSGAASGAQPPVCSSTQPPRSRPRSVAAPAAIQAHSRTARTGHATSSEAAHWRRRGACRQDRAPRAARTCSAAATRSAPPAS